MSGKVRDSEPESPAERRCGSCHAAAPPTCTPPHSILVRSPLLLFSECFQAVCASHSMATLTSLPVSPGEGPEDETAIPTPAQPSQPLSSTSAAAAGTIDTSPFYKERRGSLSMKRQHAPDADYGKAEEEVDRAAVTTRAEGERGEDGSDDEGADRGSETVKRQRMSVDLTADADAGVELQPRLKPARVLVNAASALPNSASVSPVSSPSMSRRGSMTEDQKRASFTHSLYKALSGASAPSSPASATAASSASVLSSAAPVPSLASQLEQALYHRHHGLTMEYTGHVRDIVYNVTHNASLRRRIVDGDVDVTRLSAMSWKDFADAETKREREEAKQEDLVDHLEPVDVQPGILPNVLTTAK